MLTPEQEKWLAHLSDIGTVKIVPFDPTAEEKFERVKKKIQGHLGADVAVEHYGASGLGISGQDEMMYTYQFRKRNSMKLSKRFGNFLANSEAVIP